jgi:predicted metalloprotease with PDZ domain
LGICDQPLEEPDDAMRRLNDDFARRGRFFTQEDFLGIISGLAPAFTALHQFVADYITGTRELDYETYLGYAGLRLATAATDQPELGFLAVQSFDGPIQVEAVDPGSGAERAGLQRGDILLEMDGRSLHAPPLAQLAGIKPGRKVHFRVRRGRREFPLEFPLEAKQRISYRVEEVSDASPEQRRIRQGWLEGTTTTPTAGRP